MTTRRLVGDWLSAYCDLYEQRIEAPRRFLFWSGVSAIAGALTRKVFIDEKTFCWHPNFYIILVAPQGIVKKSTLLSLSMGLLRDASEKVPHIKFGPDIATPEALFQAIAQANGDISTSADHENWDSQCALTIGVSELGNFYKSEDKVLVNLLTDLYDGRSIPLSKITKTQGNDTIYNPFINILAGTTPEFLRDEFMNQNRGWGFSSRILFVYADKKERYIYKPSELFEDADYQRQRDLLTRDLISLSQIAGQFTFTPQADEWAKRWYIARCQELEEYYGQADYEEWVAYFKSRLQEHVHKLAMILSISRRDSLEITADDVSQSISHVESLQADLPKIFKKTLTATAFAQQEQGVIDLITTALKNGPMPRSEAISRVSRYVDSLTGNRLIDSACARKLMQQTIQKGGIAWLGLEGMLQ